MKKWISCILLSIWAGSAIAQSDSLLDIKIGQMIMVGMSGKSAHKNSPIIKAIKKGIVGGVLLFEYNIDENNSREKLLTLTSELQAASAIPLFISIDQEGGQVNRLKPKYGFPVMPAAYMVAQKNDTAYARQISKTIAEAVSSVGINLNFAPVVDIYSPNCPVLGRRNRCYASNPKEVKKYAEMMIDAHHEARIYTAVKHFPGHGSSQTDSHTGLVDVTKTWSVEELYPYKSFIDSGKIDMIMSAHIVNKKLDASAVPATLSKKILTGLLRKQLGYTGVIVSDDMQMHAISKAYGLKQSVQMAIQAGIDILIFSNNIEGASDYTPENIHATIKQLINEGQISATRIDESYQRIMQLKSKFLK